MRANRRSGGKSQPADMPSEPHPNGSYERLSVPASHAGTGDVPGHRDREYVPPEPAMADGEQAGA